MAATCSNHGMFERFVHQSLSAANRTEWIEEAVSLIGRPLDAATIALWVERFSEMFRQRPAQAWEDAVSAAGGACTVCETIDEWLVHPHAIAAGMVAEVDDARYGRMKQPGIQVTLRRHARADQGRAPLLGEHTRSGSGCRLAAPLLQLPRPPLPPPALCYTRWQGCGVLDLCIILAGPTCGRTLAEFGADVIKIDDPIRPGDAVGYMDVNRGKRSIELNLTKTEAGRAIFWRLVDTADVIVENNRRGSLARLGIGDYDGDSRTQTLPSSMASA